MNKVIKNYLESIVGCVGQKPLTSGSVFKDQLQCNCIMLYYDSPASCSLFTEPVQTCRLMFAVACPKWLGETPSSLLPTPSSLHLQY